MLVRLITLLCTIALFNTQTQAADATNSSNPIPWTSAEGMQRLSESTHKVDFFKLANNFEPQLNKAFCGPASATIVLNALRTRQSHAQLPTDPSLLKPSDHTYLPDKPDWSPLYERYTQNTVFLNSPKSRSQVLGQPVVDSQGKERADFGFQIRQLSSLLRDHQLNVQLTIADNEDHWPAIKAQMINNLSTENDYLIANYSRNSVNQPGGGHISPIGAYHQPSDSFLIMDTVPNKSDWVWISADTLFKAMQTFDTIENRGYVSVSDATKG